MVREVQSLEREINLWPSRPGTNCYDLPGVGFSRASQACPSALVLPPERWLNFPHQKIGEEKPQVYSVELLPL